jgi:hypothetical protein
MRIVWECNTLAFPIALALDGDRFVVTYGRQITRCRDYAHAAKELGESIMHARACDGWLDSDKPRKRA